MFSQLTPLALVREFVTVSGYKFCLSPRLHRRLVSVPLPSTIKYVESVLVRMCQMHLSEMEYFLNQTDFGGCFIALENCQPFCA